MLAALPGTRLTGLIDPELPAMSAAVRSHFHRVVDTAYAAGRPDCAVLLSADEDPLFLVRLLLRPDVPCVAVVPGPVDAVGRYWMSRAVRVHASDLWDVVAELVARGGAPSPARIAVLTGDSAAPLAAALQAAGHRVFGAEPVAALSPAFGRVVFAIANRPGDAALLRLLRRYGGDVVLDDACLLAVYDNETATRLAEAELGRAVPDTEMRQWRDGIARPAALLLGEVVAAARQVFVASEFLAVEIAARYGRAARVLPAVVAAVEQVPSVMRAVAAGLQAEACVWALEMLLGWKADLRLELDCPYGEQAALQALAARLGVAGRVGFGHGPADIVLAMRGQARRGATPGCPRVASWSVIEAGRAPPWVWAVPDQASPPLLAEAMLQARPRMETGHDAATVAARLIAMLG